MRDKDLYAQILQLPRPWKVVEVDIDDEKEEVVVTVAAERSRLPCPLCGKLVPRRDHRHRRWRHLDTCQYKTILQADIPRVECAAHGIHQILVPWAEPGSRFTALFESVTIDWLLEASISAVARRMRLTWDEVDGIQSRAVKRGLARRERKAPTAITVDETSFRRRHDYVTIVADLDEPRVLHVEDGRTKESLDTFYRQFSVRERTQLQAVAMDMWGPYIASTREHVPDAEEKIAFDKFHVAKHLGDSVDKVRRRENRELTKAGDDTLVGTKYLWLQNRANMTPSSVVDLESLRHCALKTARAWAIKEYAMRIWKRVSELGAQRGWKRWLSWACRSRLEPVKKVARMIRKHLKGIMNAIVLRVTNAKAESINSQVQGIKKRACGFRNRTRFKNAIYFHLGGLDLHPRGGILTHTRP